MIEMTPRQEMYERAMKTGDRRVAKRLATREQMQEALLRDDENLVEAQMANLRMRQEFLALAPYWEDGMTKAQAVAAYRKAHPES